MTRKRIRIAVVAAVAVRGEAWTGRRMQAGTATKLTRSRTSGSRFSRCDQAKAASVATTSSAKTTAREASPVDEALSSPTTTATGAPAETESISEVIGCTCEISSALATRCASRRVAAA